MTLRIIGRYLGFILIVTIISAITTMVVNFTLINQVKKKFTTLTDSSDEETENLIKSLGTLKGLDWSLIGKGEDLFITARDEFRTVIMEQVSTLQEAYEFMTNYQI